jgi:hypothetical protein
MKEDSGIDMKKTEKELNIETLPTLEEVLLVERIIQDCNDSILSRSQLKKQMKGKIQQNTLETILEYLEEKNWIATSPKGITWIKSKTKLLDYMDKVLRNSELTTEDAIRLGRKVNKNVAKRFRDFNKQDIPKKKVIMAEKLAQHSNLTKEDIDSFDKKIKASATKKFLRAGRL